MSEGKRQDPERPTTAGRDDYRSPLASRYATKAMLANFSDRRRALLWRDLWIALAKSEAELGLSITPAQIAALEGARERVDFERVAELEAELRHDVMAHVHHFGELAGPEAAKIIHLGATSCFVTDNAELVMLREGLELLMDRLYTCIRQLGAFARQWREEPILAYTHFQPAQLTTVGKRACLWAQDLALDLETLEALVARLPMRGVKGTTGTQASFRQLFASFDDPDAKIRELDRQVCAAMGFTRSIPVSGQTYTRKIDTWVLSALADIAGSAAKFASDMRLLAHERELEEPFGSKQIGSSAMAYKRNPMRSERICALARFVHSLASSPRETHANQWLERTLDDSANRRLVLTEGFLATDAILNLVVDVSAGLVVNPAMIRRNMADELPFMATENVLMRAVEAGGDRQALHERIRVLSHEAAAELKAGRGNDLVARMQADTQLGPHVEGALDPARYVGRAPAQVDDYLGELDALLTRHAHREGRFTARVRV
ncbi:adenylosuccinate lyase [Pseudenhygromyxa sp. WMMC2535]|uniref:adenylosuccinate lyase n=1 Tax=Pseudenhygromyxa sp. WMMC2535 TaxID=2712867 RepID=UPI0015581335|nr:adenylosuccinate lyase [Pseudenhygromyxa sp. WMMC2535]NVB39897.1 adenylosuccinate lyase [Pseudenhygromyxa sp. WMMC2535]